MPRKNSEQPARASNDGPQLMRNAIADATTKRPDGTVTARLTIVSTKVDPHRTPRMVVRDRTRFGVVFLDSAEGGVRYVSMENGAIDTHTRSREDFAHTWITCDDDPTLSYAGNTRPTIDGWLERVAASHLAITYPALVAIRDIVQRTHRTTIGLKLDGRITTVEHADFRLYVQDGADAAARVLTAKLTPVARATFYNNTTGTTNLPLVKSLRDGNEDKLKIAAQSVFDAALIVPAVLSTIERRASESAARNAITYTPQEPTNMARKNSASTTTTDDATTSTPSTSERIDKARPRPRGRASDGTGVVHQLHAFFANGGTGTVVELMKKFQAQEPTIRTKISHIRTGRTIGALPSLGVDSDGVYGLGRMRGTPAKSRTDDQVATKTATKTAKTEPKVAKVEPKVEPKVAKTATKTAKVEPKVAKTATKVATKTAKVATKTAAKRANSAASASR